MATTRTNDDKPEQPLDVREKQKKQKYWGTAKRNGFAFFAAIFSYTGEMHKDIKRLFLEQIGFKLQFVDGEVKKSKVQAIMKHFIRIIS